MNIKENFKQATQELFSGAKPEDTAPVSATFTSNESRPLPKAPLPFQSNRPLNNECTMIAVGTRVIGSITTDSDITVEGAVDGNVTSAGDVKITGGVMGNVKGHNCDISSGITGDIDSTDRITINLGSSISGDLTGKNIEIYGHINGNVNAEDELRLFKTASVKGNIVSGPVSMESGALINGNISIKPKA